MPGTDSRVVAGGHADAAIGNGKLDLAVTTETISKRRGRRGSTLMTQNRSMHSAAMAVLKRLGEDPVAIEVSRRWRPLRHACCAPYAA